MPIDSVVGACICSCMLEDGCVDGITGEFALF